MPEDLDVVINARCINWEVPVDCAVKAARSGLSSLDAQQTEWLLQNCGLEFVVDGYSREHQSSTDSETGLKTEYGAVLKKSGKQRNREESFDRLSYLCNSVLNLEQSVAVKAASILRTLMDSGAQRRSRIVVLEIVAAYSAARMSNQSIKLNEVIEGHRNWTTKEGEFKAIKSVSPKTVRRLMSDLQRKKILPTARPSASDLIGSNKWCLDNLTDDTLSLAQEIAKNGSGTPDSIAAAAVLIACGDLRVIKPGGRFHKPKTGRENDGQKMTSNVAVQLFPGTSPRTVRKRLKDLRLAMGIQPISNPVDDERKNRIKSRLAEVVADLGGELDPDKPPFGITRKDVETLEAIKRQ